MILRATSLVTLTLGAFLGWAVGNPATFQERGGGGGADPQATDSQPLGELDALTFVRGVEVPVASARPLADGEKPSTVMTDAYLDWDFGTLTYFGEDGSVAAVPMPKNWEFRHVQMPGGGGMVALCFQPGTGLAYLLDGSGEWAAIQEPDTDLVVGDYDVTLAIDVDRVFAIRFDRFSGRSWSLEEKGWEPIKGNLQGWPPTSSQGR